MENTKRFRGRKKKEEKKKKAAGVCADISYGVCACVCLSVSTASYFLLNVMQLQARVTCACVSYSAVPHCVHFFV